MRLEWSPPEPSPDGAQTCTSSVDVELRKGSGTADEASPLHLAGAGSGGSNRLSGRRPRWQPQQSRTVVPSAALAPHRLPVSPCRHVSSLSMPGWSIEIVEKNGQRGNGNGAAGRRRVVCGVDECRVKRNEWQCGCESSVRLLAHPSLPSCDSQGDSRAVQCSAAGGGQPLETARQDEPRAARSPGRPSATVVRSVRHAERTHGTGRREGEGEGERSDGGGIGVSSSRSPPSEPIVWSLRRALFCFSSLFVVRSVSVFVFFVMPRKGKKTKHTAAELAAKIAAHKPRGKADGE